MEPLTVLLLGTIFFVVFVIRIEIVSRIMTKRVNILYAQPNWRELSEKYPISDHFKNTFIRLNKWTFKQFYPELEELSND